MRSTALPGWPRRSGSSGALGVGQLAAAREQDGLDVARQQGALGADANGRGEARRLAGHVLARRRRAALARTESAAVRQRPREPREESLDHATSGAAFGPPAPAPERTITASMRSEYFAASTNRRAPAEPSVSPSTDASTIVLRVTRPCRTRLSSSRAAVSAALPARSGPRPSRAASTTTRRREVPARRPTTFRYPSSRPSDSKESTWVSNPRRANVAATSRPRAASPLPPARRSG